MTTPAFPSRRAALLYFFMALLTVPTATYFLFYELSAPLAEPHPRRQLQTALTVRAFSKGQASLLDYRSAYGGKLWNMVYEFPLYQWLAAKGMKLGLTLEASARLVSIVCFLAGIFFLFRIVRRQFGISAALWTSLFYYVSPFNVVFARTCLIDFTATAFCLASLDLWLAALPEETYCMRRFALAAFGGAVAAVTKVTVWMAPAVFLGIYLCHQFWRGKVSRRVTGAALAALLFQGVVALAWIRWSNFVRWSSGAFVGNELSSWIIGSLSDRFSAENWRQVARPALRFLLHDWMVPAAALPLFVRGPQTKWAWAAFGICLSSILTTFHVHVAHDYYLIAESPFLIALAGVGFAWILQETEKRQRVAMAFLLVTVGAFAVRAGNFQFTYSAVTVDRESEVHRFRLLGKLTAPGELVYAQASINQWEWPYYSERDVVLGPLLRNSGLRPTAFWFEGAPQAELLAAYPRLWIDGSPSELVVWRVAEVGEFRFDPRRHVAVSGETTGAQGWQPAIDTCRGARRLRVASGEDWIAVRAVESGLEFVFPPRAALELPDRSDWGCHFELSRVPSRQTASFR